MTTTTKPDPQTHTNDRSSAPEPSLVAKQLNDFLAETYTVYNTTQIAHWNVEGPQFAALNDLFEQQYSHLAETVDEIAERVRSLGFYVNGTLRHIHELADAFPAPVTGSAERILEHLTRQHERLLETARRILPLFESAHDAATVDLLVRRLAWHEKTIWMLKSSHGKRSATLL